MRLDPTNASAHYNIGLIGRARGNLSEAVERFSEAVRLQPDWVPAVANLAWVLATTPSAALRDVDQAMVLAEHAAWLTNRRNAGVLDVLAAAQAAAGDFTGAVLSCEEALALAPDEPLAAAVRQRQALYSRHRPYISR